MKKKIIYVLITISSIFCFKTNVKAVSQDFDSSNFFNVADYTQLYDRYLDAPSGNFSYASFSNYYNKFLEWFEEQTNFNNYVIAYRKGCSEYNSFICYIDYDRYYFFLFDGSTPDLNFLSYKGTIQGTEKNITRIEFNSVKSVYWFYTGSNAPNWNNNPSWYTSTSNQWNSIDQTLRNDNLLNSFLSNGSELNFSPNDDVDYPQGTHGMPIQHNNNWVLIDSSFNIPFKRYAGQGKLGNYQIKVASNYYEIGDNIPSVMYYYRSLKPPKITFNIEYSYNSNNEKTGATINTDWGHKTFELYKYQYCKNTNNTCVWIDSTTNNTVDSYLTNTNGTYNFRVVRISDNKVVSRASITITSLVNDEDDQESITLRIYDNHCNLGQDYTTSWHNSGAGISHGGGGRSFDEEFSYFSPDNAMTQIQVYNYDLERYKTYYSFDDTNYTEITEFDNTEYDNVFVFIINNLNYDTQIYVKIYDQNNVEILKGQYNYVNACESLDVGMSNIFDGVNNYISGMSPLFIMFTDIFNFAYTSLSSEIKEFIIFIFTILIIANLINRMRK